MQPIAVLRIDPEVERRQIDRLRRVRAARDARQVQRALDTLRRAGERADNTMDRVVDCVRASATVGEICDVFRSVYGEYKEPAII